MKPRGENVEYDRLRVRYDELAASASFMSDRIASLEAEVNEQARLNGMGGSREAKLLARVGQLEAALEAAAGLRESDLDGADLYVHRWRQLLAGVTAETPVSTLCAVCDQIKELHPATHAWTAKETWSRFPRAMLDPDFKAETKVEPRAPCEWVYAPESNAIADCKNCGMPIGEHKMATANRTAETKGESK
jgi:hypothetical protein